MKPFFRYLLITVSIAIVLILLWASLDKLINLHGMNSGTMSFTEGSIENHYKNHLILGYIHIIPGIIFLILGAYQLIPYFRKKNYSIHRILGKVFLLISVVIFTTAIILALFYPFGNYLESTVTLIFGTYLLFCVYKAYQTARNKQFVSHRNWVTRIYFIAISVSTIRGVIALFMVKGAESMQSIFGVSFLIAFLLHFTVVELWIRYLAD